MSKNITRLGRETIVYGVGQVLTKLISFLLLPLFTAYLSPSDYGVISILSLISLLAAPVFGLGIGMSAGVVYFENDSPERRNSTIWTAFLLLFVSGGIFVGASILFSRQINLIIFDNISDQTEYFIFLTVLATLFSNILAQPFALRLQFEQKSKLFVAMTTIATLVTIGATIFAVVYLRAGVTGYLIAGLAGSATTFLLYFFAAIPSLRFTMDGKVARELLQIGAPSIPAFAFLFITQNSGRYFLEKYNGLADLGIYTVGNNFGMVISVAITAFTTAWFPYFNSFISKQEEAKEAFGRSLTYYFVGAGSLSVMFFIFAKPVVSLMTQAPFHGAYQVVGFTALGHFMVGVFSIVVAGAYFAKKVYVINFSQSAAALTCIVLNILLIPVLGIIGTAVAFFTANLVLCVFQLGVNVNLRFLEVRYEWKRIGKFTATIAVLIAISFAPRNFSILQDFLFGGVLAAILVAAVYYQLNNTEKQFALGSIRRLKENWLTLNKQK